MAPVRQGSFLGGELAPQMWGRTDSPAYGQGLRLLRNAFVTRQGSICKRPGTEFCYQVAGGESQRVRLVPFIYSEERSFVLVFSDNLVRVVEDGGLLSPSLLVATPYGAEDLARLKFAQSGDVLVITHPDHAPRTLTRHADNDWRLELVDFGRPTTSMWMTPSLRAALPTPDVDNPASDWEWMVSSVWIADDRETYVESAPQAVTRTVRHAGWVDSTVWNSGTSYALGDYVRVGTSPTAPLYQSINGSGNVGQPPASSPSYWTLRPNAQAPEVLPVGPDKPVNIIWGVFDDTSYDPPTGMVDSAGVRIYRGRNGSFGLVGWHRGNANRWWTDFGQAPDYSQPPPDGRNPFEVEDLVNGSIRRTERPAVVGYHQERRIYARTDERPETLWASRVADYDNFDQPIPLLADSALDVRLASRRREEVRSMLALERLLLFTNGSVWGLDGGGIEGALDATAIPQARILSEVGASWVDPVVVDGAVLYPRAGNDGLQRLIFSTERGGYNGGDVSVTAQHLLRGHRIQAIDYARVPHGLTWVARDDGLLLSATYIPEADVAAWAQHDVGGQVESLCVIPEDGQDTLYLAVRRHLNDVDVLHVERIRHGGADDSEARYLDCHTVHGPSTGTQSYVIGTSVGPFVAQALQDGIPTQLLEAGQNQPITITRPSDMTVQETVLGFPFEVAVDLLDLPMGGMRQKRVVSVGFEVRASSDLWLGEDEDRLVQWRQRQVSDGYGPTSPFTGLAKVNIGSGFNLGGRAVLRQREPLHLEVLGITREVDGGG